MDSEQKLRLLAKASGLINSSLDLDKTLQAILEAVLEAVKAEASSIILTDKDSGLLFFRAATGVQARALKKYKLSPDKGIAGWVVKHGRSAIIEDALSDERHDRGFAEKVNFLPKSLLAIPIQDGDVTVGVLEVLNSAGRPSFGQEDCRFLEILSPHIANALKNSKAYTKLTKETENLRRMQAMRQAIVGRHPAITQALDLVRKIAPFEATVLIQGESGTGKELFARAIHDNSDRIDGPFVGVNCTAMPEALLESELFGHEKGSFTGALATRIGKFEMANCGTLFMDEIGDMSLAAQAKVLRAIEGKVFQRVGGSKDIESDTRIVCATNRDLKREVQAKRFREDLYYRINECAIQLPTLRARKEDIPELVDTFLSEFRQQFHKPIKGITKDALQLLLAYEWPGNVRQLRNVIKSGIILAEGNLLQLNHLPNEIRLKDAKAYISHGSGASLDQIEKGYILSVLTDTHWNKSQTAKILKVSRPTLNKKIRDYQLHP